MSRTRGNKTYLINEDLGWDLPELRERRRGVKIHTGIGIAVKKSVVQKIMPQEMF
jgi:hypothetical protein